MADFDASEHPHRRYNPLLNTHVLVSPHRTKRPWLGQLDPPSLVSLPEHDPKCHLCPGNERMGSERNPDYEGIFTFPNDFPALLEPPAPAAPETGSNFFQVEPVTGECQVICFSPRHDLTLARMSINEITKVIRGWAKIWQESACEYVQIFENRGSAMGCSNPHPHGQVWSLSYVPTEPATELASFASYADSGQGSGSLLLDYAMLEKEKRERVVVENEDWLVVTPFWSIWPFEVMVLPAKRKILSLGDLSADEETSLAEVIKGLLVRYDNLFSCPFPYSMGIHQAPSPSHLAGASPTGAHAQLHFHFYPPLLRSASVRKFLVGFEMMAEAQRDLTPEQAALRLRAADGPHYLDRVQKE